MATVLPFNGVVPALHPTVFLAAGSCIIGDVEIGEASSVWFNSVVRGDINSIRVGARTNVQDNSTLHVSGGTGRLEIGSDVTIGHRAIVHACRVGDGSLIGMGAIILDGADVGSGVLVAAGSVVREGERIPDGVLVAGVPARVRRGLTPEEREELRDVAGRYVGYAKTYRELTQER